MIRTTLLAGLLLAPAVLGATTYTLEPDYTQGVVRWDHLGFSLPTAQFGQAQGSLRFDPANPAGGSVTVTIPLASLTTGVAALDEHLRSDDFFEIAKFPTATFSSIRVAAGAGAGRLEVTGTLNLHGVTRPATLAVTLLKVGTNPRTRIPTVGFEATTTLKRSDFGLGRFAPQVSDAVELRITCQGAESKAYAEYLKAEAAESDAANNSAVPPASRK